MPHNLVDVDTWTAAVAVPDDGDACNAASVEAGFQDLADRTAYTRNRVPGAAASYTLIVPATYVSNDSNRFSYAAGGVYYPFPVHSDVTTVGAIGCQIHGLPTSGTITGFAAKVTGLMTAGAHLGLLGTAPQVVLARYTLSTGAVVVLDTANDPHATTNQVLYEAPHDITSAVLAETLSADRSYYFVVSGEGGGNEANDKFAVYAFAITIAP